MVSDSLYDTLLGFVEDGSLTFHQGKFWAKGAALEYIEGKDHLSPGETNEHGTQIDGLSSKLSIAQYCELRRQAMPNPSTSYPGYFR